MDQAQASYALQQAARQEGDALATWLSLEDSHRAALLDWIVKPWSERRQWKRVHELAHALGMGQESFKAWLRAPSSAGGSGGAGTGGGG